MKTKDKNEQENALSRRDFCKNTVILSSGLALGTLSVQAAAHVYGDETIKVALIGCGGRGTGAAAQALSTQGKVQLVAMADAFPDRLQSSLEILGKKFAKQPEKLKVPKEHQFVGFDAFEKAIPLADVVILATPPGFRPSHFEAAVKAGKHIFMEKPVATDAPGIRKVLEMAKIAKEKKLNVVVGLQRHYQRNYREVLKRLRENIGDIVSGQVYWNSDGVWVNPRKAGQTEMEYQMRNWYYFNWLCGDHIVEQHIHNIDVANWFIGEYPSKAQGMGGRQIRTGKEFGEIFDHHFVEFEYPSGAIIASQCRHQPKTMSRVSETFQGTKGRVTTDGGNLGIITDLKGQTLYKHQGDSDADPYQVEHDELFASIRAGQVINDAENGAKSTMTAIMGRMATYSGQVITWEEALNSEINLMPPQLAWDASPLSLPDENGLYAIATPGKTNVLSYKD